MTMVSRDMMFWLEYMIWVLVRKIHIAYFFNITMA